MSSSPRFIRVVWSNERVVFPLPSSLLTQDVQKLLEALTVKLGSALGSNKLVGISTEDGFSISPLDVVEQVVEHGATYHLSDYQQWLDFQVKHNLSTVLQYVDKYDYIAEKRRSVSLGRYKQHGLYVKTQVGNQVVALDLFENAAALKGYSKPGCVLVGTRQQGKVEDKEWWMQVEQEVDSTGCVVAFVVALKTAFDLRAQIVRFPVVVEDDGAIGLQNGHVQQTATLPRTKQYTLPQDSYVGSKLDLTPRVHSSTNAVSTGDSPISFKQSGAMFVEFVEGYSGRPAVQKCYVEVLAHSKKDNTSQVKIQAEWKDGDAWKPCRYTGTGYKQSEYYYHCGEEADAVVTYGSTPSKLAFQANIELQAPFIASQRRVHPSLGDPLHVRFTVTDMDGLQTVLEVSSSNPAPDVNTMESYAAYHKVPVVAFFSCDDTNSEERLYVPITQPEGGQLTLCAKQRSTNPYIMSNLEEWALLAYRAQQSEVLLPDLSWEKDDLYKLNMYAIVDLETNTTWALKFEFKTSSSSAVYYYAIPE